MSVEFLQIEPTTRCNFICGFCCGRSMTQTDIDVATFERALAAFPTLKHLDLQGEGEPLMHPRFFEMLDAARARGVAVSFITNGSYFTQENVDRLLSGGVTKINVSLESADPETFREIRGGKLDKVIAGIERLMAERKKRELARPLVGFSLTVLKRTANHLPGVTALYEKLGLDAGIMMQPLQSMAAYADKYDEKLAADTFDPTEADALWVRFNRDKLVRKIQRTRAGVDGFHEELMVGWSATQGTCPWLDKGMYVNREGLATACCMVKDEAHAYGRIGVDSTETILAARDKMRVELADGKTPKACEGCEIARYAVMGKVEFIGRMARGVVKSFGGGA